MSQDEGNAWATAAGRDAERRVFFGSGNCYATVLTSIEGVGQTARSPEADQAQPIRKSPRVKEMPLSEVKDDLLRLLREAEGREIVISV